MGINTASKNTLWFFQFRNVKAPVKQIVISGKFRYACHESSANSPELTIKAWTTGC